MESVMPVIAFKLFSASSPFFTEVADALRGLKLDGSRPYRPERHYMRGPGPKWREKHGLGPADDLVPVRVAVRHG
jgi:hypothetical protein